MCVCISLVDWFLCFLQLINGRYPLWLSSLGCQFLTRFSQQHLDSGYPLERTFTTIEDKATLKVAWHRPKEGKSFEKMTTIFVFFWTNTSLLFVFMTFMSLLVPDLLNTYTTRWGFLYDSKPTEDEGNPEGDGSAGSQFLDCLIKYYFMTSTVEESFCQMFSLPFQIVFPPFWNKQEMKQECFRLSMVKSKKEG